MLRVEYEKTFYNVGALAGYIFCMLNASAQQNRHILQKVNKGKLVVSSLLDVLKKWICISTSYAPMHVRTNLPMY